MGKFLVMGMLAMSLAACVTERAAEVKFYTAAEIDAMNAETQCRALARNLVQIYRCSVRR